MANAKRSCLYCGTPTKRGRKGEHIVPEAIGGSLTLNDVSDRVVCPACNSGVLSQLDKELCSRSFLSVVASQRINAHLWQVWDIDHAANNLLVEARPLWAPDQTLYGLACYPQITFERDSAPRVRCAADECYEFGQEHFAPVLFKAVSQCFRRHCAGKKSLHLERIHSGNVYKGCRLPPRVFARRRIGEIARNINEQAFILRFVNEDDRLFAYQCMDRLGEGRQLRNASIARGTHTPTVSCCYSIGDTLRALMKIALNLIAAYCRKTPVNYEAFASPIRAIRGQGDIPLLVLLQNGFVHAEDIEEIKGKEDEHTFRLVHMDDVWHVFPSFFGGSIGAYVRIPGPNCEEWNCADIVAPIRSKNWSITTRRTLPVMKVHVEWRDPAKVIPCFKTQYSEAMVVAELARRK